jgi:hypothetical protein
MAKRSKTAKADIKIRLLEGLRSKIERMAKRRGVSMNAEMIERLESAYALEENFNRIVDRTLDRIFGGPELRRMAAQWAITFQYGAEFGARLDGKDPDPKEFTDPRTRSYREGTLELLRSLTLGMPPKDLELFIEQFKGRVLSDIANERLRRELEKGRSQ